MPREYTHGETAADAMGEYLKASEGGYGTGAGGVLGEQEYARKQAEARNQQDASALRPKPRPKKTELGFEKFLAGLISLAAGVGIAYYGIAILATVWYLPVGVGILAALAVDTLLKGPLRFLMTLLKWVIILSIVGWVLLVLFGQ